MIQMLLQPLCVLLALQFLSYRLITAEPATNTTNNVTRVEYNFFDLNYHLMDENKLTISGNKSLIVFVHGFRSSPKTGVVADLGKSLVQWTDSNVVLVDWSKWTQKLDYADVVFRLPVVATYMVDWLNSLRDRGIVQSFDDVTLIGHSLGAQLIGYTGHMLNGTINRVIALDPAQPNFKDSQKNERVDVDSGQFVMVFHTSTMFLGLREPVGHVDFYFNGGQMQPSCNADTVCGHIVVLNYLADSLKNSSEFKAYRCHTLSDCEKKIVDNKEPPINMNIFMPNSYVLQSVLLRKYYVDARRIFSKNQRIVFHNTMQKEFENVLTFLLTIMCKDLEETFTLSSPKIRNVTDFYIEVYYTT